MRPHLEYCAPAWSPWTQGDRDVLEAVQKRAVKAVSNLKSRSYEERLLELGLDSLEERRKRGDLLMAYRVHSGKDNVDPKTWFTMSKPEGDNRATRRQAGYQNVDLPEWNGETDSETDSHFWSVRVCDPWNDLPDSVKMAETVEVFKNSVDNLRGCYIGLKDSKNWDRACFLHVDM